MDLLRLLDPGKVDAISLHGTGTETNDLAEANGVAMTFGTSPRQPASFGIKGAIGHLLGAAASVEFGITCLTLRDSVIPGTTNHMSLDDRCDLRISSESQHSPDVRSALKLSLGFGGHVAACLIHKES